MAELLEAEKELSDLDKFFKSAPSLKDGSLIQEKVKSFVDYIC